MSYRRGEDDDVLLAVAGRRPNSRGTVRANCPFCVEAVGKVDRRQCLHLNTRTGKWGCFRCDSYGWLAGFEGLLETPEPVVAPPSLPAEWVPLWCSPGLDSYACEPAREYLASRHVGARIQEAARIGACTRGPMAGRVVVPIDGPGGVLAGWVGRSWVPDVPRKYLYASGMQRQSLVYNGDVLQEETETPVLVVEGVFDCFPFWPDAVAVLGKPSEGQVGVLAAARRPVVVVLDGDAWEEGRSLAWRLRFDGARAGFVRLPACLDPDEVDPAWLAAEARASTA